MFAYRLTFYPLSWPFTSMWFLIKINRLSKSLSPQFSPSYKPRVMVICVTWFKLQFNYPLQLLHPIYTLSGCTQQRDTWNGINMFSYFLTNVSTYDYPPLYLFSVFKSYFWYKNYSFVLVVLWFSARTHFNQDYFYKSLVGNSMKLFTVHRPTLFSTGISINGHTF